MELYPAIDLLGGKCVRLHQGDYERSKVYGEDPVAQALAFEAEGADWIHIVDLDAARSGSATNSEAIGAVADAVSVPVQTGGGIRDHESAGRMFDLGVTRVVVGTAAMENPAFVRELASERRVAVGLDARGREVAVHGWQKGSGRDLIEVAESFAADGVEVLVVTEIGRDGTMEGPDTEGLMAVLAASAIPLIASGGVGTVDDLLRLRDLRSSGRSLSGAIVGRAIYEGSFTVSDAVETLRNPEGSA